MAGKLPIVPVAIAAGAGIATYFAATQLSQRVTSLQSQPLATPAILLAVGVLVAKKHVPIGIGIAGAAGAIGYLNYKAGTTTAATTTASTTSTATAPAASTTPASTTTPSTTTPASTTDTSNATATGQQALNNLTGSSTGAGTDTSGTSTDTSGSTGTSGYSAGKLLSGPHMHSHLANWRRGSGALMASGKLLSGPRPHSHLAPWHRNAGHYDAPAPGEAGGLRGGAFGLTSD